jgi:hypothetical protein
VLEQSATPLSIHGEPGKKMIKSKIEAFEKFEERLKKNPHFTFRDLADNMFEAGFDAGFAEAVRMLRNRQCARILDKGECDCLTSPDEWLLEQKEKSDQ